jgi:hypothetical protein
MSRAGWIVFSVVAALLASLLLALRYCSAPVEVAAPATDGGGGAVMPMPLTPETTRQIQDARQRSERWVRSTESLTGEAAPLREAVLTDVRHVARSGTWTRPATIETAQQRIEQASALAEKLAAHRVTIGEIRAKVTSAMEQAGATPPAAEGMLPNTAAGRAVLMAEAEVTRGTMILELIRTEALTIMRQAAPARPAPTSPAGPGGAATTPKAGSLRASLDEQLRQIGLEPSR